MSQIITKDEVPRDLTMVQELRREITRNSAEISLNFWQEFENIRATQRNRMAMESRERERISSLMRDGQQEANKEAEALSRSISAQGMITLPSALAAAPPAPKPPPLMSSLVQGIKNMAPRPYVGLKRVPQKQRFQNLKTKSKTKLETENEPSKPSTAPAKKARTLVTAKANKVSPATSKISSATSKISPASTKVSPVTSKASSVSSKLSPASSKATPNTSKIRLAKKAKK